MVSEIGFGAFKIGRNEATKYAQQYELPSDADVARLLNGIVDLGVNFIDTAPAYGSSEERIGKALAHRRGEVVLSTKVGEEFERGKSRFDFSAAAVSKSVQRSLQRMQTDVLDVVFVHSDGNDAHVLGQTDVVQTLAELKESGLIRAIGFSGKTVEGARLALQGGWADALMVEYHLNDQSHAQVIEDAKRLDVGIVVKKGLASGKLEPKSAIGFLLRKPCISSVVIGGLNLDHFRSNIQLANALH